MRSPGVLSLPQDGPCGRITVKNWSRFQHYKQRRPPWIKLHRELLDDFAFACLPLASQALAPRLWLLASEADDGSFPDDVPLLVFRLHCTEDDLLSAIKPLIEKGFLSCSHDASVLLASRKQEAHPEKRRVEERNDNGKRIATPSAVAIVSSWSVDACTDWIGRFGGTAPGGPIGKALKPLVTAHGWSEVQTAWRAYLSQAEAEYASAARFASTYGRWSGTVSAGGKESLEDKNRRVIAAYKRPGEE